MTGADGTPTDQTSHSRGTGGKLTAWRKTLAKTVRASLGPPTVKKLDDKAFEKQHDEVSMTLRRVMLAIVTYSAFCLVTLFDTDLLLQTKGGIKLPFVDSPIRAIDFFYFGPLVLIAIALYMHIFVGYWQAMSGAVPNSLPFLFNMDTPVTRLLTAFLFYWLVPLMLLYFFWSVQPFEDKFPDLLPYLQFLFLVVATTFVWLGIRRRPLDKRSVIWNLGIWGLLVGVGGGGVFAAAQLTLGLSIAIPQLAGTEQQMASAVPGAPPATPPAVGPSEAPPEAARATVTAATPSVASPETARATAAAAAPSEAPPEAARATAADTTPPAPDLPIPAGQPVPMPPTPRPEIARQVTQTALARVLSRGLRLEGKDLRNVDLREFNLINASLARSDLRKINLSNRQLMGADLNGADLTEANLIRADLTKANLALASLASATLTRAVLSNADLEGATLEGARMDGAWLDKANLKRAILRKANLMGANLEQANLTRAHLTGATLRDAHLDEANLMEADLRGTKGLRCEQLKRAKNWEQSFRDNELACNAPIPRFRRKK